MDKSYDPSSEKTAAGNREPSPARRLAVEKLDMRRLVQLDACTRCGECLNWCPVHDQDPREDVIPRTKILKFLHIVKSQQSALRKLMTGPAGKSGLRRLVARMFNVAEITEEMVTAFAESLYECSTCGQCQIVCPANINTVELWEEIRQIIVEAGYGPMEPQKVLVKSVKSYDNPWQQPRQGRAKWIRRSVKEGLIDAPPRDITKSHGKVLLWFGCTAVYDDNVRQIAVNTVNILEALGIDYGILGGAEKCCGSVLLRMGDEEFGRIAGDNIEQLNGLNIDTLVSACSGCFKTIKEDYPRVGSLNFDVLHMVEYLKQLLDAGQLAFNHPVHRKVTFHDPCHLGRAADVFDDPRAILKAIPGLDFVEMERIREYSRCCGAGGGVKAGFPEIQAKMSLRRIQEAESTGADILASACPFCYAGLQVGIKASNSHLVMKDVTSLVAESLLGYDVFARAEEQAQAKAREKAEKKAAKGAARAERKLNKKDDATAPKTAGAEDRAVGKASPGERDAKRAARKAERAAKRATRKAKAGKASSPDATTAPATSEAVDPPPAESSPADAVPEDPKEARKAERAAKRAARKAGARKAKSATPKKKTDAQAASAPSPDTADPAPVEAPLEAPAADDKAAIRAAKKAEREQRRAAKRAARLKSKGD